MATETDIVGKILKWINDQPHGFAYKNHGDAMSRAGIPDVICSWRGQFVAIEVKKKGEKPSKIQQYMIDKINKVDGISFVAHSLEDVVDNLQPIDWSALAVIHYTRVFEDWGRNLFDEESVKPLGLFEVIK